MWSRWPTAGTPHTFSSRADFDNVVSSLQSTGAISDGTKIYWDMRPSARFETIEFRVIDVCMTVDEAVMIAGLARGLARTCYDEAIAGETSPQVRPELLRAANWRAARYGLDGQLILKQRGRVLFRLAAGGGLINRAALAINLGLIRDWLSSRGRGTSHIRACQWLGMIRFYGSSVPI